MPRPSRRRSTKRPFRLFKSDEVLPDRFILAGGAEFNGAAPPAFLGQPFALPIRTMKPWILVIGIVVFLAAGRYFFLTKAHPPAESNSIPNAASGFQCAGKIYCSQMVSCEEALFYLHHCPGVKIDGDGDKIPCEKEWCGHMITNRKNFP